MYDRLTKTIMKQIIEKDFNCIDVGCHKGEILDDMLKYAPKGKHWGFEPIPYMFQDLQTKYNQTAHILPYALSDKNATSSFQLVKNAPAYSGIMKRKYDVKEADIEEIQVELKRLDDIIPTDTPIHFIKIDVEGGEYDVLKGAINILKKHRPYIIFEFGLGASDFYGTTPEQIYRLLNDEVQLKISSLKDFVNHKSALSLEQFKQAYDSNKEYYFIAHI